MLEITLLLYKNLKLYDPLLLDRKEYFTSGKIPKNKKKFIKYWVFSYWKTCHIDRSLIILKHKSICIYTLFLLQIEHAFKITKLIFLYKPKYLTSNARILIQKKSNANKIYILV